MRWWGYSFFKWLWQRSHTQIYRVIQTLIHTWTALQRAFRKGDVTSFHPPQAYTCTHVRLPAEFMFFWPQTPANAGQISWQGLCWSSLLLCLTFPYFPTSYTVLWPLCLIQVSYIRWSLSKMSVYLFSLVQCQCPWSRVHLLCRGTSFSLPFPFFFVIWAPPPHVSSPSLSIYLSVHEARRGSEADKKYIPVKDRSG